MEEGFLGLLSREGHAGHPQQMHMNSEVSVCEGSLITMMGQDLLICKGSLDVAPVAPLAMSGQDLLICNGSPKVATIVP